MSNQDHDESLISTLSERIWNGLIKENPTFVLLLGMCPTLAVTTSAINGLGMGVTTLVVLALSNMMISALRKVIPDKIRIPAFIVIIASFVTIVELLLNAYIPSLYSALGLYIPLIVVNCIILGRAESYAYSHKVLPSLFDGLGMGMGFTLALTIIGSFREILGSGKVFGYTVMPEGFVPVSIFVMAPGAFFVLAMLTALQNLIKDAGTKKGKDMSKIQSGCGGNCMECNKECKVTAVDVEESKAEVKNEEPKPSENKPEPAKTEASKDETVNAEIPKAEPVEVSLEVEETKVEEIKVEDAKVGETKPETKAVEDVKTENAEDEDKAETSKEASTDDELVLLDLNDYKKAIHKNAPSGKKPTRKKASVEKAQAMLSKANEALKEDKNND